MAEKRRLLNEMDKCFKKVDEGFETFDEIMSKMSEANSDNQREKFQDDSKKEIKKLQRLRDQIKGWQNSSEIKDKDKLSHYRKLIEQRMETFKDIERENKTKPHSKQGLSAEDKLDPKEKEKSDTIEWLNNQIRRIQDEIDRTESKLETLNTMETGKKRGKKDDAKRNEKEIEELKKHLERVKFHLMNLEVVMRLIVNEKLEIQEVLTKLKEPVEMYIESLDPESDLDPESLDPEDIYEELNLSTFIPQLGGLSIGSMDEDSKPGDGNNRTTPSNSPPPGAKEHEEQLKQRHQSGSDNNKTHTTVAPSKPIPATPLKLMRLGSRVSAESSSLSSPPPATPPPPPSIPYNSVAAGIHTASGGASSATTGSATASITSAPSSAASLVSIPPTFATSQQGAPIQAVHHHVSGTMSSNGSVVGSDCGGSVTTAVTAVSVQPATAPASVSSALQQHPLAASAPRFPSSVPAIQQPQQVGQPTVSTIATSSSLQQQQKAITNQQQLQQSSLQPVDNSIQSSAAGLVSSAQLITNVLTTSAFAGSALSSSGGSTQPTAASTASSTFSTSAGGGGDSGRLPTSIDDLNQNTLRQVLRMGQPVERSTQPQTATIPPWLGASPLGMVPITPELETQLNMLEAALPRVPIQMDSDKPRSYLPKMPCQTPPWYPQAPLPNADTLEYYLRLSPETLFFTFYYMEGSRAQLLAAKALKKLSWRFHTKYLMWFQRHEEPKQITDDFEQGTYVYFDFEKWSQRKKEQFTFEYRYLEDKDFE